MDQSWRLRLKRLPFKSTVRQLSLYVHCRKSADPLVAEAAAYALERGLILADTKLEFGLLPPNNQLILIDELLTPDSSRYWSAADYTPGKPQASFDKQYLRDWLIANDLRNAPNVTLPQDVVAKTREKYEEARDRVMSLGQFAPKGKVGVKVDGGEAGLQTDQVTEAVSSLKV